MSDAHGGAGRTPAEVREARPTEWNLIGLLLGESFQTDPLWTWLAPKPARRQKHLGKLFSQLVRTRVETGHAYLAGDDAGAAVWAPPGKWKVTTEESARMALPMMQLVGLRHLRSRLDALKKMEQVHPTEEHWYLEIIGARPDQQGRGIGSALLAAGLDRVDEEGHAAYLECSNEANLPLYRRFGFEVTEEVSLGSDAPPVWSMWRAPR